MRKSKDIPVITLPAEPSQGIIIAKASFNGSLNIDEVARSHRDGGYTFILQTRGTTYIEIDFKKHALVAPALIYIHPDQVHRVITFEKATIYSWIITIENLLPEHRKLLQDLAPVNKLPLTKEASAVITEAAALCIKLSERTNEKLYHSILKGSCNTLVAWVISQYLALSKPIDKYSRFEVITKAFRSALEDHFTTVKSPREYASRLNISTAYLNECVKATTGRSVSYHIQQRIVLEAKRLLYHSDSSVKEIAAQLGYDDYSYFTRLFVKISGMTPLAFRSKNHE